jgi:hypothetical protein
MIGKESLSSCFQTKGDIFTNSELDPVQKAKKWTELTLNWRYQWFNQQALWHRSVLGNKRQVMWNTTGPTDIMRRPDCDTWNLLLLGSSARGTEPLSGGPEVLNNRCIFRSCFVWAWRHCLWLQSKRSSKTLWKDYVIFKYQQQFKLYYKKLIQFCKRTSHVPCFKYHDT